jgi:hypothetical protein
MAQDETGGQQSDDNQAREATDAEKVVTILAAQNAQEAGEEVDPVAEAVEEPAKVMRIGSMIKQLLDEVRQAPLDDRSRDRVRDVFEQSVKELAEGLSPDLREELGRLTLPFDSTTPSDSELRVAQAQLVGWLEGLFHGIQATLFAQQMAARAQLEQMRQRGLPAPAEEATTRRSTYL